MPSTPSRGREYVLVIVLWTNPRPNETRLASSAALRRFASGLVSSVLRPVNTHVSWITRRAVCVSTRISHTRPVSPVRAFLSRAGADHTSRLRQLERYRTHDAADTKHPACTHAPGRRGDVERGGAPSTTHTQHKTHSHDTPHTHTYTLELHLLVFPRHPLPAPSSARAATRAP
jgi:hypothetical protein